MKRQQRYNERGNALIFILIAVVLFGIGVWLTAGVKLNKLLITPVPLVLVKVAFAGKLLKPLDCSWLANDPACRFFWTLRSGSQYSSQGERDKGEGS